MYLSSRWHGAISQPREGEHKPWEDEESNVQASDGVTMIAWMDKILKLSCFLFDIDGIGEKGWSLHYTC